MLSALSVVEASYILVDWQVDVSFDKRRSASGRELGTKTVRDKTKSRLKTEAPPNHTSLGS